MPKLSVLLDQIDAETLLLPEFQRGYVWNRDQVRGLFRSLYLGYPVGSLLTWQTDAGDTELRGSTADSGVREILLDGQQRLTSLYGVVRGRPPEFFEGKASTFDGLHFNADTESFEFYAPVKMKNDPAWYSVTEIYELGMGPIFGRLMMIDDREVAALRAARLGRLMQILDREFHIERITGQDKGIDTVVDIFNRVNSGGTKLSKGDLALARITAHSPEARDRMRAALATWSRAGYHFALDWLLRNVNAIATGRAPFSALEHVGPREFNAALERATRHVGRVLDYIAGRLGLDHDRVLMARGAFPVLVKVLDDLGGRFPDRRSADKALYWYVHAGLWGRYAGATETALAQDLETLRSKGVDGLIEHIANSRGGSLSVRPEDFGGSTLGARFYPLLYMMTRTGNALDLGSGIPVRDGLLGHNAALEVHHIIPRARLAAYSEMHPDSAYDRGEVNAVANFALITKDTNLDISAKEPQAYLAEIEAARPGVLSSQWIPLEPDLWNVERFRDFLRSRRELLARAANTMLDGLFAGEQQLEDLPRLQPTELEDAESDPRTRAIRTAVAALDEMGCAAPEFDVEICDPADGSVLAVAEALWSEGLQAGRGPAVVLELDTDNPRIPRIQELGYVTFTDPDALVRHAQRDALIDAGELPDNELAR